MPLCKENFLHRVYRVCAHLLPQKLLRLIPLLLAVTVFCSSCDTRHGVNIGDEPPLVPERDINGNVVSPVMLKGKIVVIYFWVDSCCGDSLKYLIPLYTNNHFKGLEMLAINAGDTRKTVESYIINNNIPFTMLLDEQRLIARDFSVIGFPTILIVGRDGLIRKKILGLISSRDLEKVLLPLLDAKATAKKKE